jgi:hypothetical protein
VYVSIVYQWRSLPRNLLVASVNAKRVSEEAVLLVLRERASVSSTTFETMLSVQDFSNLSNMLGLNNTIICEMFKFSLSCSVAHRSAHLGLPDREIDSGVSCVYPLFQEVEATPGLVLGVLCDFVFGRPNGSCIICANRQGHELKTTIRDSSCNVSKGQPTTLTTFLQFDM